MATALQTPTTAWQALRWHWPEYLMEAAGLGLFMMSAGIFATLLEAPASPVPTFITDPFIRRLFMGLAMGLTAVALIYSPWGQQSGAHLNPAVTLTFLRLGKVAPWDAVFYILAQFMGGTVAVFVIAALLGSAFTEMPVTYVATRPGELGPVIAFLAEFIITLVLMMTVLTVSNIPNIARWTGVAAGCLVALYITVEAPLSGMSMNPARSFASAAPSGIWDHGWIYYTAPLLGMLAASQLYLMLRSINTVKCAKLDHAPQVRCIHCHYDPRAVHAHCE